VKILLKPLSLLFLSFLMILAIPVPRVHAAPGATLAVSPTSIMGVPGGSSSTVSIQISNVTNLVAYDVILSWSPSILTCTSLTDAGTIFSSLPHQTILLECGFGFARIATTLLGTTVSVPAGSSLPILFVTFAFVGFGMSSLIINSDTLVDNTASNIPHTDTNGVASTPPPAQASLLHWKARPDIKHLSISTRGTVDTLFADVAETSGVHQAFVRVIFRVISAAGDVSSASTSITLLAPGQEAIISGVFTAPSTLPLRYFVFATLQVSGDGVLFINSNSKTFTFTVVP
jgi:hypothetical protein